MSTLTLVIAQPLRKLPADCQLHQQNKLALSVGKVSFIRLVSAKGTINVLGSAIQVRQAARIPVRQSSNALYQVTGLENISHKERWFIFTDSQVYTFQIDKDLYKNTQTQIVP